MTSPVSYANAAANKTTSVEVETKVSKPVSSEEVEAVSDSLATTSVEDVPVVEESTEVKEDTEDATSAAESVSTTTSPSKEKTPKKNLLPAPVPTKSAWGATSTTTAVTLKEVVDEQRGPVTNEQQGQKFIKPITNKWVPITAKVTLPNTRGKSQQQPRRKKNAGTTTNQKTTPKKQGSKDGKTKEGSSSPAAKKEEIVSSASSDTEASVEESVNGETKEEVQEQEQAQTGSSQQQQQQNDSNSPQFNQSYQKFNQQKPYRRYNNQQQQQPNGGNYNGQYQKRYSNPEQAQQQQQQPQQPQQPLYPTPQSPQQVPGFYHPQPFVPQPPFQTFNNRQFRPQQQQQHQNGGQYRGANRSYRGGYRNGNQQPQPPIMPYIPYGIAPYQQPIVHIPPPISPKQEPQQALIQQIDYYFSLDNLIRDVYLRKNMDGEGWVGLGLILEFKRVKIIVNGIQNEVEGDLNSIILDSIKQCNNLEIKYLKEEANAKLEDVQLRVKENYEQWLLPAEK
ncbi:hypothetical protein JA1_002836 [Spathaspora sp. JA1]|nr:hypothetical protein JA1_002836 [Spathaspora sp. JA1]